MPSNYPGPRNLIQDRVHRLAVQLGSRSSAQWRTVGHVVRTDKGLVAHFSDDRFAKIWDHWQQPKPGSDLSDVSVRFAALDGEAMIQLATVRLPRWLVAELGSQSRRDHSRRIPGGPSPMRSAWARVERNAPARTGRGGRRTANRATATAV